MHGPFTSNKTRCYRDFSWGGVRNPNSTRCKHLTYPILATLITQNIQKIKRIKASKCAARDNESINKPVKIQKNKKRISNGARCEHLTYRILATLISQNIKKI